jgi:hypothetical protein
MGAAVDYLLDLAVTQAAVEVEVRVETVDLLK